MSKKSLKDVCLIFNPELGKLTNQSKSKNQRWSFELLNDGYYNDEITNLLPLVAILDYSSSAPRCYIAVSESHDPEVRSIW